MRQIIRFSTATATTASLLPQMLRKMRITVATFAIFRTFSTFMAEKDRNGAANFAATAAISAKHLATRIGLLAGDWRLKADDYLSTFNL
ncbi:MAG: hypothetical protein LCI00_26680 [Chloroflexi bacterium]|nr:hypothetical protein [Chloroflexota bacterium]MCC6892196.1 hypothetical protein [Anaerolineae bacterium]